MIRVVQKVFLWATVMVALVVATIASCFWLLSNPDPADHFEVIDVVPSQTQRHATVYQYSHANSSSTLIAVWIASGQTPSIGSKEPARGAPALIFTGAFQEIKLKWPHSERRLVVEIESNASVRKDDVNYCYFDYDKTKSSVCVDTKQAVACIQNKESRNPALNCSQ